MTRAPQSSGDHRSSRGVRRGWRAAQMLGVATALSLAMACQTVPGHGPLTTYRVVLRSFGDRDAHAITRAMIEEFPGYESHHLITSRSAFRRYEYRTTARSFKLEEWLSILLGDQGFDVDRDVRIQVQGTDIVVDQLAPSVLYQKCVRSKS